MFILDFYGVPDDVSLVSLKIRFVSPGGDDVIRPRKFGDINDIRQASLRVEVDGIQEGNGFYLVAEGKFTDGNEGRLIDSIKITKTD